MERLKRIKLLCAGVMILMVTMWVNGSTTTNFLLGKADRLKETKATKEVRKQEAYKRTQPAQVEKKLQTQETTKPRLVIILAYMHTGSSYTGSLFHQHPGSFYDYEALRNPLSSIRRNRSLHYLDGSSRKYHGDWLEDGGLAREMVQSLLSCKYESLNMGSFDAYFYTTQSSRFENRKPFQDCLRKQRKHNRQSRSQNIKKCLPHLTTPCLNAKIRAFKFIRFPMSAVERLMNDNDNLKIIHLVRDPRASLDSQIRKNDEGSKHLTNFINNSRRWCNKMLKDLTVYQNLPDNIQKNIKRVRYEDLTDDPLGTVREMFEFTNVPYTADDVTYVESMTRTGNRSSTASELPTWRTHLTQPFLEVVDRHCRSMYKELRYIEYSDMADIRDIKNPTYRRT